MPEGSPDRPDAPPRVDPTRDIRLPPLPDRPVPAVPPEWSPYLPSAAPGAEPPATAQSSLSRPPVGATAVPPPQVDEPTDRLASPSDEPLRQGTRSFAPPSPVQLLTVSVTPRRRLTTKVLWALVFLTLAVIVACGVYLVVLVNGR
jgi:hypothetical protein